MATTGWNAELDLETHNETETAAAVQANAGLAVAGSDAESLRLLRFEELHAMLDEETFRFEFFQAVRLLERMEKERKPVGHFHPPGSEAVRFTSHTTLGFPPSQLYELRRDEDGQLRLAVQFMGLCASVTVLPQVYREYLLQQLKDKDTAMRDFFDIFNHRMISLFYRGWEKYRSYVGYEARQEECLTPRMLDFLGLGTAGLRERSVLPDRAMLAYAGLLGRHARTESGLRQILEDYFEVAVTITQFAGTWRSLPSEDRTCFGGTGRASEVLGVGTVVGNEVWDHHGRIRICIGPLGFDEYVSFLPGHGAYRDLEAWVKFYSSGQYEAEVQLVLKRGEAPECELGQSGKRGPRLGLVSWLKTQPLPADPGDTVFLLT